MAPICEPSKRCSGTRLFRRRKFIRISAVPICRTPTRSITREVRAVAFSRTQRQEWIDALRHEPVDVVIVGGGVVGCSIAAHLAHIGLPCALVERDDLAS